MFDLCVFACSLKIRSEMYRMPNSVNPINPPSNAISTVTWVNLTGWKWKVVECMFGICVMPFYIRWNVTDFKQHFIYRVYFGLVSFSFLSDGFLCFFFKFYHEFETNNYEIDSLSFRCFIEKLCWIGVLSGFLAHSWEFRLNERLGYWKCNTNNNNI